MLNICDVVANNTDHAKFYDQKMAHDSHMLTTHSSSAGASVPVRMSRLDTASGTISSAQPAQS